MILMINQQLININHIIFIESVAKILLVAQNLQHLTYQTCLFQGILNLMYHSLWLQLCLGLYYLWEGRQWDGVKQPHSCVKQKETCPCRSYGVTTVSRSPMKWIRGKFGIWGCCSGDYEDCLHSVTLQKTVIFRR